MSEEFEKKPTRSASKPVRVSPDLAKYLEEAGEQKNLKASEILDSIFDGYLKFKSGSDLSGKTDTLGNESDANLLKILAGLREIYKGMSELKSQVAHPLDKEQNDTFLLVEKQLNSLNDATKKYGTLHNLISVSSGDIRDGLLQAEDSIEKIITKTETTVNKMTKVVGLQQESTKKSVEATEKFVSSLRSLEQGINDFLNENIKQPTSKIMSHIESETRDVLKKSRIKANISVACSILAVLSLVALVSISYSPLSNYSRDMEEKYKLYSGAYYSLRDDICAIKPNRALKDIQSQICKKK